MRLLLRFDSSPRVGMGHKMRCLALAESLRLGGYHDIVVFGENYGPLPSWIRHVDPDRDGISFLRTAEAMEADLIVADVYGLSDEWFAAAKLTGADVLRITDSAVTCNSSDYLLMQGASFGQASPAGEFVNNQWRLAGSRWALIRPAFFNSRHLPKDRASRGERVLVVMGGTDPDARSAEVIKLLADFPHRLALKVIAGPESIRQVERAAEHSSHQIEIVPPSDNLANLLTSSDAAIGAGGMSALERCVVGVPSLLIETAANQRANIEALADAGAAVHCELSARSLVAGLVHVLQRPAAFERAAALQCDGLGTIRCAKVLGAHPPISLRPATEADCDLLYGYQILPDTRRWFRNPDIPSRLEHLNWLRSTLADPDRCLQVIEVAGFSVGSVRLDRLRDGNVEVAINIVPEATGLGLGKDTLKAITSENHNRLIAEIHHDNVASKRIFEAAGFRQTAPGGIYTYGDES